MIDNAKYTEARSTGKRLYGRIRETLAVASQLIIASPVKLPPKVVLVAKYVVLALGVLEAVEGEPHPPAGKGGGSNED